MKLALWKRALLGMLLTLSVAAPSVATFTAGHAAAGTGGTVCPDEDPRVCGYRK
jgi:hypothetical protein